MAKNGNLHAAKAAKNDEFYTRLDDIWEEMNHYTDKFKGKRVFCNCDDPCESNFVKYFMMNFNRLGLKELMATGYKTSPILGKELGEPGVPYALRVTDTSEYLVGTQIDLNPKGVMTFLAQEWDNVSYPLTGNVDPGGGGYYEAGDFRSDMCVDLLKECDVVVTNPPFSLYRLYVAQLIEYEKEFLIVGNPNAITYKEFFPLLKNDKVWIGYKSMGTDMLFNISDEHARELIKTKKEGSGYRIVDGTILGRTQGIWFTNLDHQKRHHMIDLSIGCTYFGNEDMYPRYDNYDAINVDKTNYIPCDYFPCISVPVSFADRLDSNRFVLLSDSFKFKGDTRSLGGGEPETGRWYVKKYPDKALVYVDAEEKQEEICRMMIDEYGYAKDEIRRYSGVMGVPISFLDKYCPEQFEIVSFRKGNDGKDLVFSRERERVQPYFRILVRRRSRE